MEIIGTVHAILRMKGTTVWTIGPEATVFEAISMLAEKKIGALPVMEGERLIGIISERDYTRKVALKGKSSKETAVREILSGEVISVQPDTSIADCMRLMSEHHIRHLPVLAEGKMAGIISVGDLVDWIISAQSATIEQLHGYITGRYAG
jgi:CBS domain-containing protein